MSELLKKNELSIFWTGFCPQCELRNHQGRMRLNAYDFFECESCRLQIILSVPGLLATILNFRGTANYRRKPDYADLEMRNEVLCPQTDQAVPFTNLTLFENGLEIQEYICNSI
ncbi:MAG: hypothetical protein IPO39_10900 [Bacteroidetes bacterium]|nr:hypothetical protein [Bacteroidota bacterium]MBK9525238.1 hypothetical protein [Bacteroidota bacterium]MBK9543305.1 hypothetical protein [Bacteroidota bacterium]MBP6402902.1 hypothetical protein [Bacteroidia bacterium]